MKVSDYVTAYFFVVITGKMQLLVALNFRKFLCAQNWNLRRRRLKKIG